ARRQGWRWRGIERCPHPAVFPVRRQSEKRKGNVFWRNPRLSAGGMDATGEHLAHLFKPNLEIVSGPFRMRCERAPRLINEKKRRLGSASINTEVSSHTFSRQGWMETPFTTRLTVPAALGSSGLTPNDSERSNARDWPNMAQGRHNSRSATS